MDDKGDLLAFARDSATAGIDLYELLGVDSTTSREDIHRAWRRQGLKYHPDKAGANFDPVLYERFARARDVLVDDAARQVYDTARAAAAQRKMQADQMTAERRQFKDELEAAEKAAGGVSATTVGGTPFGATPSSGPPLSTEREKLREAGRRRAEERQRQEQEAQERLRKREDERIAEIERLLSEKEARAKRRAEKKAARSGGVTAEAASKPEKAYKTFAKPAESEWKKLVSSTKGETVKEEGPIQQRPLFAYTMNRLKAAGEAQRRQQAEAAGVEAPAFEPQWQEIEDPQVRKFITRVPRFSSTPAQAADVIDLAQ